MPLPPTYRIPFVNGDGTLTTSALQILQQLSAAVDALALVPSFAFADLPTAGFKISVVIDSNTNTWGATIAGGGSNKVLAWRNGTVWTVIGK